MNSEMDRAVPVRHAVAPTQAQPKPSCRAGPAVSRRAMPCLGQAKMAVPHASPFSLAHLATFIS